MDETKKVGSEKDATSDAEALSTADDNKEQDEKPKKKERKRRKRELDKLMATDDDEDDDDSDNDVPLKRTRDLSYLSSPGGPISPGHAGAREPRSCVLSQRQKKKPLSRLLEQLLKNLEKKDQNNFFAWPVNDNFAPNYSNIIKRPMDFLTMKQKIDENQYKSLNCFINDFKLMCNNAMKYNKSGTVYHKAAKKLLHVGLRQLQPDKLRPLGNILTYMYEIPIRELGFDMGKMDVKALKNPSNNPSNDQDQKDNTSGAEDDLKMQMEAARERHRKKLAKKAFRRMDSNGYTSLNILVDNDGMLPNTNQKPVSLGAFIGKLTHGTGTLPSFKEDRRNLVKGVKPLNYGAFGSYAPAYDSTFATLSKDDCHLLYHTYGEEVGIANNESLLRFAPDSPWSCIYNMEEMFPTKAAPKPAPDVTNEPEAPSIKVDIDQVKKLSELGIEVDFLADMEEEIITSQKDFGIKTALINNLNCLRKLENEQRDRLSQAIPPHLSLMLKPSLSEQEIARTVLNNLKEMICKVQPKHVVPVASVRKAMGITLDHLDTPLPLDEFNEETASLFDHSNKDGAPMDVMIKTEDIKQEPESVKVSSELKQFITDFSLNEI